MLLLGLRRGVWLVGVFIDCEDEEAIVCYEEIRLS